MKWPSLMAKNRKKMFYKIGLKLYWSVFYVYAKNMLDQQHLNDNCPNKQDFHFEIGNPNIGRERERETATVISYLVFIFYCFALNKKLSLRRNKTVLGGVRGLRRTKLRTAF